MPPATEALRTGYEMYIVANAVPRMVFVNGTATDTLKAWAGTVDKEYMVNRDANPRTYVQSSGVKGYDKKALWSARVAPTQDRLEDPCDMTGDVASISAYVSCTYVVTPDTEPTNPATARRLQSVPIGSTQAVTIGTTINVASVPDCVAIFIESCCFSTNTCTSKPVTVPG